MPTMHYFIDSCLMYFTPKNQIEISFPQLILKTKVIKFLKRMFCLGGFCPGGFWQGGFLSRGFLARGVFGKGAFVQGFLSGGLCPGAFVWGVFVLEPELHCIIVWLSKILQEGPVVIGNSVSSCMSLWQ